MNQLTVKGLDEELLARLQRLAESEGTSLNQLALRILRTGIEAKESDVSTKAIGSSLDDLFGTWSHDEAEAFNKALEVFETVDERGCLEVRSP